MKTNNNAGSGRQPRLVGRLVQAGMLKDSEGDTVHGLLIECGKSVLRDTPLPLYRDVEVVDYEPCNPWRSIDSAPRDEYLMFWIVPLGVDDCYTDTSGNPIRIDFKPHIMLNKYGRWSALSKATHWMPLPIPPNDKDLARRALDSE